MATMTPTPPIQPRFGTNLRAAREKKGLAQNELAAKAGIGPCYLCNLEHGEGTPSIELHCVLSQILGLNPGDLLK